MAKKKTLKQASEEKKSPELAESLAGSANEIWLAGLGAFAKAQSEGQKIYDKLIEQGKDFEGSFKSQSQKATKDIKSSVNTSVSSAKKKASESWDKLENVFETRVEKSLHKLGVPTNDELNQLVKRIEALTEQVAKLAAKESKSDAAKTTQSKTSTQAKTTKKAAPKATKKKAAKKKVTKKAAKKSTSSNKTAATKKSSTSGSKKTRQKTTKKTSKKSSS